MSCRASNCHLVTLYRIHLPDVLCPHLLVYVLIIMFYSALLLSTYTCCSVHPIFYPLPLAHCPLPPSSLLPSAPPPVGGHGLSRNRTHQSVLDDCRKLMSTVHKLLSNCLTHSVTDALRQSNWEVLADLNSVFSGCWLIPLFSYFHGFVFFLLMSVFPRNGYCHNNYTEIQNNTNLSGNTHWL